MRVKGSVVVVTGGGAGIGAALCRAFARAGAEKVVAADLDEAAAVSVAAEIGGVGRRCDVSSEDQIAALVEEVESQYGPIAIFCSNAGIAAGFDQQAENVAAQSNDVWQRSWAVNVMSHVYAARHLVPRMRARGAGHFLITASAAGLLSQIGSAAYSTTKHAAVGFAESLAIAHRAHGIGVSLLCPQGVDTPLLRSIPKGPESGDGVMSADEVAGAALLGIEEGRFLILPHGQVADYMRRKVENYDRWVGGMAKLQEKVRASVPPA